jgi:hypothetical protein
MQKEEALSYWRCTMHPDVRYHTVPVSQITKK